MIKIWINIAFARLNKFYKSKINILQTAMRFEAWYDYKSVGLEVLKKIERHEKLINNNL